VGGSESIGGSFMFSIVACVDVGVVTVQIVVDALIITNLCGGIANARVPACIGLCTHGQFGADSAGINILFNFSGINLLLNFRVQFCCSISKL
jgi:hypothetical protein